MLEPSIEMAADHLIEHQEILVDRLHQSLLDLIYDHRSYLRPAQLRRVAEDEANALMAFVKTGEFGDIEAYAEKRASQGLGLPGILHILDAIKAFCREFLPDTDEATTVAVNHYANTYLQAFVNAREAVILKEQERIRAALQRSFSHNNLWLQTAAEVSRVATSTLNQDKLLSDSVNLIRDYFNFHHVGLFLVDDAHERAILSASSSAVPIPDMDLGYSLEVNHDTMVGQCILDGKAQIAVDVGTRNFRRDRVILEDARSVMMLPLTMRGTIIGVIFIQSTQIASFGDDDITRLQTVADQLTNAIQNARLYHELEIYSQGLEKAVKARTIELERTKERVEGILNNNPDAILLLSAEGNIELCNTAFYGMFGYREDEILNLPLYTLVAEEYAETVQELVQMCSDQGQSHWFQVVGQRKDEDTFDAGAALAAITNDGVTKALVCSLRNITEQVQAEEQIKASLQEKEVLLREIHHRVKNNMQVISSLLALQAGYTDDQAANQMFRESQNRIRSMALVHELLYQSRDLARIDFAEYVHKLTQHLLYSYLTEPSRVKLDIISGQVYLDVDMAIPCGLIINELISNSLKHAFPDNRQGIIQVELWTDDKGLHTIIVRDNGVGLAEDLNVHQTETLGLQLVTSLAGQLNATIGLDRHQGTTFEIRFALPETEKNQRTFEKMIS